MLYFDYPHFFAHSSCLIANLVMFLVAWLTSGGWLVTHVWYMVLSVMVRQLYCLRVYLGNHIQVIMHGLTKD